MEANTHQNVNVLLRLLFMRFLSPVYVATWIALSFGAVLCVALWGVYRITGLHDGQLQEAKQVDVASPLQVDRLVS